MINALFILLMFWLGGESGASFPWSHKWQQAFSFSLGKLPEFLASVILAHISLIGYSALGIDLEKILTFGFSHYHFGLSLGVCLFFLVFGIIYAGIQSATWMFLKWTKDPAPNTERGATTKPLVDWIAERFGWKLGDEGYSWVAATVKGTIITLPMGGLGGILFALCYEIGSHTRTAKMRAWFGDTHWIAEGLSFAGIGAYALIFLNVIKVIT